MRWFSSDAESRRTSAAPSFLCLSQESSRRASARRKDSFQPKDLAGWIPVTSTGMRRRRCLPEMPYGLSRLKIQS
ncbi:hypothetical protein EXN32_13550 [Agrobacterium tumefaciens]|nr:hypothetical protein EXN32_13550 [Agrobacterium tumefaciens]